MAAKDRNSLKSRRKVLSLTEYADEEGGDRYWRQKFQPEVT